ncbi:DUF5683 domain-containing protein [Rufibacter soli]
MRLLAALSFCLFLYLASAPQSQAQVVTAGPDSVKVATPAALAKADTAQKGFSHWSRPAKAAFYSAVVPGLGQAYNKSYWKIPLVYATGGLIGYFIYDNNRKYQDYSQALRIRFDGDPLTIDKYAEDNVYGEGRANDQGSRNLRSSKDFFRKYRDLDIILAVLAWGLNVLEAHVDAHLKAFDVSEDLSLHFSPALNPLTGTSSYAGGVRIHLTLK